MLAYYGLPLKPKLVLWVFFANDLKDAWRFQQFGSGAMKETPFWQNPIRAWLAQHSAVYITFSFFWYNRDFFYRLSQAEKGADPGIAWWLANIDPAVPEVAQGLDLTEATILEASRQAQASAPALRRRRGAHDPCAGGASPSRHGGGGRPAPSVARRPRACRRACG